MIVLMIDVINALSTRFSEISVANGYKTNVGANVLVMPDSPIDAVDVNSIPNGVIAFDIPGESYSTENYVVKRTLNVSIQTGVPYQSNPEIKACEITEDLMQALVGKPIMQGVKCRLKDSEIGFPSSGSPNLIVVNMTAEIEYLTKFN